MHQPSLNLALDITGVAVGGDGVARDPDGRVVFVAGALPGERVRVVETEAHRRHARARVVEVLTASPDRVAPPCPAVARGCGGCGWQFVAPGAQHRLKGEVVRQALERIGGLADPPVELAEALPSAGYRTSVRLAVTGGTPAFRAAASHELVTVDGCPVAHPLVDDVIRRSSWGAAAEVVIRAGARTGDRLVVAAPTADGVEVPAGVLLVGADELDGGGGRRAWYHEVVADHRFRVSARSFFQARPDGADQLAELVRNHVEEAAADGTLLDLYAGVGLFAATVGGYRRVVAVERSRAAVADARHNLAGRPVTVVAAAVERFTPRPVEAVVADPARAGLGRQGVAVVAATRAPVVALVSCDAGALGRDTRLLGEAGYRLVAATVVDLFPGTPHVEVVSRFER